MKMKNIILIIFTLIIGVAEAWGQTALPTTLNGSGNIVLAGGTIYTVTPTSGNTVTINGTLVVPTTGGPVTIYIPAGITLKIKGSSGTSGGSGLAPTSSGPQNGGTGGTGAKPAISVPNGATLIITGEGRLDVQGGDAGNGGDGGNGQNGNSGVNNYGGAGGSGGGGGGGAAAAIGGYGGNGGRGGKGGTAGENSGIVVGEGNGGPGAAGITSGIEGIDMGNVYIIGNVTLVTHEYDTKALHGINGQNGAYDTGITLYYFGGRGGNGGFSGSVPYAIGGGGYGGYGGNGGDGGNIRKQSSNPTQDDNPAQSYDNTQTGDNGNLYIQNTTLNQPALNSNAYDPTHKSEITSNAQMPSAIAATFTIDGESTPLRAIYYGTVIEDMDLTTAEKTRTGYTFNGYKIKGTSTQVYDASGTFVYPITTIASSTNPSLNLKVSLTAPAYITLEADWIPNTYTVTLDKQNGSGGDDSVTATYDSAMPSAEAPTRTGYTFGGYYTSTNGGGTQYYNANMSSTHNWDIDTNPSTLYAKWTAKTYTVNLDMQDGSGGTAQVTATFDSAMPSATAPTKTGYTFAGYYTEENGGGTKYYNADMSSAHNWDIDTNPSTLYAKWTPKTYTVNLDMQNGSGGTAQVTATFDSAMPSATAPSRTGYTFAGYYTSTNGGGTQYYNANMSSTHNWDIDTNPSTLYAKWTAKTYTVNLDMQEGSGGTAQVTATFDSAMPSATAPSRTGYTFGGYYSAPNGEGTPYYDENMASVHNWNIATTPSTIYAYWEAISYQVTYDANGGLINGNSTFTQGETYDATYSLPEYTPTLNNYEFLGWFTSEIPSQGDKVTIETTVAITEAQTLYAHWSPISVEAYSAETQLGGNYFRTFFDSQVAHELPTGVTAYKGKIEGDYFMLTAIDVTAGGKKIIPKNVPVILRMEPNDDTGVDIPEYPYQITKKQISLTTSESELTIDNTDNELIGSDIVIATAVANSYILSFGSNGLGFYEWSTHPLEAHKAYVIKDSANPAKALTFRFEDDVTGINDAITDFMFNDSNMAIYNLNGIRLSKPQKGLNIINGRKVWVK